jgi:pimeloyl-ACP methyl ester carboxylesterase
MTAIQCSRGSPSRHLLLSVIVFAALTPCGVWAAEDFFFDSNGVKIHYTDEGQGEPVLLIHGFAADIITNWGLPGIRKALAREYRVIAIDNRGHGKSGKPHDAAKYGMEMVEDAVRLLDHLKIKKAHVIGYSMGGIITLKLAATHPERLRSVTIGGAGWMKEADLSADKIAAALDKGDDLSRFISEATPPGQPKPSELQVKLMSMFLSSYNDNKALAAVARGWTKLVVTEEDLKAIRVPTLLVVGSNDFIKSKADDLKGRLPGLKSVVIDKLDHFTTIFSPKFLESLQLFLREHRQPGDELQDPSPLRKLNGVRSRDFRPCPANAPFMPRQLAEIGVAGFGRHGPVLVVEVEAADLFGR